MCVSLHLSFRSQEGDHCQIDAALYTQVTAAILEMSEFVFCDAFKDRRASLHLDFFMTKSMLSAFCNSPGIPPVSVKQLNLICLDEFDLFFYFLTACKYVQTFSKLCGATSKQIVRQGQYASYRAITLEKCCRSNISAVFPIV